MSATASVTADRDADVAALGTLDDAGLGRRPPFAWVVSRRDGRAVARAGLYLAGEHGLLGHFAAAPGEAAKELFVAAELELRARGCSRVYGPVNGSTWERYRFVVDGDGSPPFFLEPMNPPDWPRAWEDAGYAVAARYVSMAKTDLGRTDPRYARHAKRLLDAGTRVEGVPAAGFEAAVREVYPLVRDAFAQNFLYAPVTEDELALQYLAARPLVDPRLCLVARRGDVIAGFVFAYRDPTDPATVVLKTLAARAGLAYAFTGVVLAHAVEQAALALGASRVVYALMHEDADSRRLGEVYGHVIRRYALYAKPLTTASGS